MTTSNNTPFVYQEASFFIGLELTFTRPFKKYPAGSKVYVHAVTDFGLGCFLDIRSTATPTRRIDFFGRDNFYDLFRVVPFGFFP